MSAAVAPASAYSQLFASSPSIDARLNLSLDDLIKERRKEAKKEVKQKKRESVKQEQTSPTKKATVQQQKKKARANAQTDKRQEKMNTNRGLPPVQPKKKQQQKDKENNNANVAGKKNKTKQQRKKTLQSAAATTMRKVVSPQAKQQQSPKQQNGQGKMFKKNAKQQPPQLNHKAPTLSPKQQSKKMMTFVVQTTKNGRAVNQTTKGKNLKITLVRSKGELRRIQQQQKPITYTKKQQRTAPAARAWLPGKSQPKTRKVLAQKIVKKAKTPGSRKQQWTSKNGKFVVRKPVTVRKA